METKEADHRLNENDRDQAISYARLVHPIAPYALVTNGTDWKLFDSISKEELAPSTKINPDYRVSLPEDLRNEALSLFLGHSKENLLRFCGIQTTAALAPLTGSPTDLNKKFIPELHAPDPTLMQELNTFLGSNSPGFLITADSGMGKTCELCYHARSCLDRGSAVLFFQGLLLESSIVAAIGEEFNWTFALSWSWLREGRISNVDFRRTNGQPMANRAALLDATPSSGLIRVCEFTGPR